MSQTDFETTTQEEIETAKDADGIPYCCKHHCRMTRNSGGKKGSPTVYYKCQVPGCEATAQILKVVNESVVPATPVTCPRCKNSICERDKHASDAAGVVLKCPKCQWKTTKMATPQFANLRHQQRTRKSVEELGAR